MFVKHLEAEEESLAMTLSCAKYSICLYDTHKRSVSSNFFHLYSFLLYATTEPPFIVNSGDWSVSTITLTFLYNIPIFTTYGMY